MAHGVFDVLHPGHLNHLEQAAAMGDVLLVSVTADRYVEKGPGRPVHTAEDRVRMLTALGAVDTAFVTDADSAIPAIEQWHPDIYVKGPDYPATDAAGNMAAEQAAVEAYGGQVAFTEGEQRSSTAIINAALPRVSERAQDWLRTFKTKFTSEEVLALVDKASKLTVTVLGESIVDHYIYVEPMGRSPKESVITWRHVGEQQFAGGVEAIAAHCRSLSTSANVQVVAPVPLLKTRYVEVPHYRRVYSFVSKTEVPEIRQKDMLQGSDVQIVGDYGHGAVRGAEGAQRIASAGWTALTVQANSLNWGYNTLRKWPGVDYFVVDKPELFLTGQSQRGDLLALLKAEVERMSAEVGAVTLGHEGCLLTAGGEASTVPALADQVVDRIGAGDAFLAVTAPLVRAGAPLDVVGFVGNVAGALQVARLGNSPIASRELKAWVVGLLK